MSNLKPLSLWVTMIGQQWKVIESGLEEGWYGLYYGHNCIGYFLTREDAWDTAEQLQQYPEAL